MSEVPELEAALGALDVDAAPTDAALLLEYAAAEELEDAEGPPDMPLGADAVAHAIHELPYSVL